MLRKTVFLFTWCMVAAVLSVPACSQTAEQAWLKYRSTGKSLHVPQHVSTLGQGLMERTAAQELERGLAGLSADAKPEDSGAIVLGTAQEMRDHNSFELPLDSDEFAITWKLRAEGRELDVIGGSQRGVLFGVFALLRHLAQGEDLRNVTLREKPAMAVRWVDEWDNANGSIERGYAGRSIFFDAGHVRAGLQPVREYARLLASIGVNGCNLNNVNNADVFLAPEMLKGVARIADVMRPYGVRVALSVDIASPEKIGGLKTYDPLDPTVIAWWKAKTDAIYALIPDFGGFTVKADSEGQPGPASYGRTPADAANLLANALAPHHGVVLYRAFVYNHHLDWRDPKADRARAAYDIFHPLDGTFAPNVIVQIKEGPIDFQAQEPVSPLFSGLEKTNEGVELQITQEYTGQQRHLVYLAPMWKWVLDYDLRANNRSTPVKQILTGRSFDRPLGGMIGVAGIGQDAWLGSPLALANLYAFGRLAWNPDLRPDEIAAEWASQTFGDDPKVVNTIQAILMQSWPAYVDYTGPLGMQTLTDITGTHYGPNIEASENNGWGQWHRADHLGVGMDRTTSTGTGYVGQYSPAVARLYEDVRTTPDNLVTFFHHVPYTWKLQNGSTVIQYIYDSHYKGAEEAVRLGAEWNTLQSKIDPSIFFEMQKRLTYQAGHAIVWRDAVVQYFLKLSGIPDEHGRAGHFPGRYEAEDAELTGYQVIDVQPWEDASRGKAVSCPSARSDGAQRSCSAEWTYNGRGGRNDIATQYFDLQGGAAKFTLLVNGKAVARWMADAQLPSRRPHGDNSTRSIAHGVQLRTGDRIRIEGTPEGNDPAAVDYIEITPELREARTARRQQSSAK